MNNALLHALIDCLTIHFLSMNYQPNRHMKLFLSMLIFCQLIQQNVIVIKYTHTYL